MKPISIRIILSALAMTLFIGLLFGLDWLCYQQTLPVTFIYQNHKGTLTVGDTRVWSGPLEDVIGLQLEATDPLVHEYQIDGTDSTNNQTLDTQYLEHIASSFYYRFQSWMRDLDGTSRWRDIHIQANRRIDRDIAWPENGQRVNWPATSSLTIQLHLHRPETQRSFSLLTRHSSLLVTLNRNDRFIQVAEITSIGIEQEIARVFFPTYVPPFLAMVLDTVVRTLLWSVTVILVVLAGETLIAGLAHLYAYTKKFLHRTDRVRCLPPPVDLPPSASSPSSMDRAKRHNERWQPPRPVAAVWRNLTAALHPLALVALWASFVLVAWIAKVQYNGQPHIYDASAYLFAAKMYAGGQVAVPAPSLSWAFPGPFIVTEAGKWFAQYPPGTALALVPGAWLGVPWLIEPLLGTLALFGTGLIAARLYNRTVATLAVILGTLSPFYSYLAASYLSHAVALFYLVWGTWCLLGFLDERGRRGWRLPLAAIFFSMAALTRDMVGFLYIGLLLCGLGLRYRRRIRRCWRLWLIPIMLAAIVAMTFVVLGLGLNAELTGNALVTPRTVFYPADHWGFGPDVGFYGQHTLAAGLVNLDEQLTALAIDLYGWPFYLTFAIPMLPFLLRRATRVDWFCLAAFCIVACTFVGYFYHGIYLGPRYLFESLPFLLILTARGILALADFGKRVRGALKANSKPVLSVMALLLTGALLFCSLQYFWPRQIALHTNYSGLPAGNQLDLNALYHPPMHHALIVTDNQFIYQMVLFALNDPLLQGDVIYALGTTARDYAQLRQAFPGRTLYRILFKADGGLLYEQIK